MGRAGVSADVVRSSAASAANASARRKVVVRMVTPLCVGLNGLWETANQKHPPRRQRIGIDAGHPSTGAYG